MVVLVIILWILSEAYRDAGDILEGNYIEDHTSRTINRALVGVITALINPIYGLITVLLFWGLFDTILNVFRKLPIWYIGGKANTDKLAHKYPILYWAIKITSIIIAIVILI